MGADLYITEINEPMIRKYEPLFEAAVKKRDAMRRDSKEWEAAQAEVTKYYDLMFGEGYFRDSYNATNLLCTLGLSWWRDVIPLCTESRELRDENLKKFREMVISAKQRLPSQRLLRKSGACIEDEGENSLEEWHKYYVEKRQQLLNFLDQAIAMNTPIRCSL